MRAAQLLKRDGNVSSPALRRRDARVREQVFQFWREGLQNDNCLPSFSGWGMTADEILGALLKILEMAEDDAKLDPTIRLSSDMGSALIRRNLDIARFALDLGQNTNISFVSISESAWEDSLTALRDLIKADFVDLHILDQMDRELAMLDTTTPCFGGSLLNAVAEEGDRLMREDPCFKVYDLATVQRSPIKPTWRYFYSIKLFKVDVFSRFEEFARVMFESEHKPWSEAVQAFSRLDSALEQHPNPADLPFLHNQRQLRYLGRDIRTRIRLLRVAVRYLATTEILDLEDGYREKLRHEVAGGRLKVWSMGRDCVDHGGVGDWKPAGGRDVVLEVER